MRDDQEPASSATPGLVLAAAIIIAVAALGYAASLAGALLRHERQSAVGCNAASSTTEDTCAPISAEASVRSADAASSATYIAAWQLGFSALGLVGGGLTVLFAYRAWKEARRTADAANRQIRHAREDAAEQAKRFEQQLSVATTAAEAAKLSADAIIKAERAWVFLHDVVPEMNESGTVLRWAVVWKNSGKTPAFITKVALDCATASVPPDPKTIYGPPVPGGAVIGAGGAWQRGFIPDAPQVLANHSAGHLIYLSGQITYLDVHQKERHSWFTRQFTGEQFVLGIYIDPQLNGFD